MSPGRGETQGKAGSVSVPVKYVTVPVRGTESPQGRPLASSSLRLRRGRDRGCLSFLLGPSSRFSPLFTLVARGLYHPPVLAVRLLFSMGLIRATQTLNNKRSPHGMDQRLGG